MRKRSTARRAVVAVVVAGLLGAGALSATAAPAETADRQPKPKPETVRISDPDATPETRSLFSYLREQQGKGVLFGHQQTTEFGVTWDEFTETDGLRSDVKAGVGDHPAMFGWDTGHLGYGSSPGEPAPEENFQATVKLIETAHNKIGGVHTLASHMDNFVTGGDFYDTNGDVVTRSDSGPRTGFPPSGAWGSRAR